MEYWYIPPSIVGGGAGVDVTLCVADLSTVVLVLTALTLDSVLLPTDPVTDCCRLN